MESLSLEKLEDTSPKRLPSCWVVKHKEDFARIMNPQSKPAERSTLWELPYVDLLK